jgi:hypothetical protein
MGYLTRSSADNLERSAGIHGARLASRRQRLRSALYTYYQAKNANEASDGLERVGVNLGNATIIAFTCIRDLTARVR